MINGVGSARPLAPGPVAPRAGSKAFRVAADTAARTTSAREVRETTSPSLLSLQEDPPDHPDRRARQGAEELLRELGALHRALLAGEPGGPVLDRAEALLAAMPPARDPALAAIQRQITLRVRIEQARRGR